MITKFLKLKKLDNNMETFKSTKNKNIILFLIFFILLATAIYFLTKSKESSTINLVANKKHEIPARPKSFEQGVLLIIKSIKKARVAVVDNNATLGSFFTEEAFIIWRDVVNEYINNPPEDFKGDLNWTKNLSSIYESIKAANDLLKNNQIDLATEKLDECRSLINNVSLKVDTENTDRQLFSLLLLTKKVASAKTIEEAKSNLSILKFDYTNIKNLADKEETKQLFLNFETVISEIDNATEATLGRSQAQLMPMFIRIYELF
jgi:hypothetical protein